MRKLEIHPDRRRWTLGLGSGWNVERLGDVLKVVNANANANATVTVTVNAVDNTAGSNSINNEDYNIVSRVGEGKAAWKWTVIDEQQHGNNVSSSSSQSSKLKDGDNDNETMEEEEQQQQTDDSVRIQVPSSFVTSIQDDENKNMHLTFFSTTLRQHATYDSSSSSTTSSSSSSSSSLRIVPPWRSSSIKLRQFLRGQKIPVHLRDDTLLLFVEYKKWASPSSQPPDDHDRQRVVRQQLVAVCVREKWIVDKQFSTTTTATATATTKQITAILDDNDNDNSDDENGAGATATAEKTIIIALSKRIIE